MKQLLLMATLLNTSVLSLQADTPVRVLVWDERQEEQKQAYHGKYLGDTIAEHLQSKKGLTVTSLGLSSPDQGLSAATLDQTDVVIYWSHKKNADLDNARAQELVDRVKAGKVSLIVLHSAHWSKPFVKLMQSRAIDDAKHKLGDKVPFTLRNENPIGMVPKKDAPLTPRLVESDKGNVLELPLCVFPSWRADAAPSQVKTLLPDHPIAKGLPLQWTISKTEMYSEPFHVPTPDQLIFEEHWDLGEHFRSGSLWNIDKGRVFYFRPGHETYPVFLQDEPLQVLENAVRWLAKP